MENDVWMLNDAECWNSKLKQAEVKLKNDINASLFTFF